MKRNKNFIIRRITAMVLCAILTLSELTGVVFADSAQNQEFTCGQTEHTHVAGQCYTEENIQICEDNEHTHEASCFGVKVTYTCTEQEHIHTEECVKKAEEPGTSSETGEAADESSETNEGEDDSSETSKGADDSSETSEEDNSSETSKGADESSETSEDDNSSETSKGADESSETSEEDITSETSEKAEAPDEESTANQVSFAQKLLAFQTLKELYDTITADEQTADTLTAEELTAILKHTKGLYDAIETPTTDEEGYYALLADTFQKLLAEKTVSGEKGEYAVNPTADETDMLPAFSVTIKEIVKEKVKETNIVDDQEVEVEKEVERVEVSTYTHDATVNVEDTSVDSDHQKYVSELVDAALHLVRYESKGLQDKDAISCTIDGTTTNASTVLGNETVENEFVAVFDAVYDAVYDLLLQVDTSFSLYEEKANNASLTTVSNGTQIWKIETTELQGWNMPLKVDGTGRVVIIHTTEKAGIEMYNYLSNRHTKCTISGNNGATLAFLGKTDIQGKDGGKGSLGFRSSKNNGQYVERAAEAIDLQGGNIYVKNTEIYGFNYGDSSTPGDSTIILSSGNNNERHMYMSDSSMHDLTSNEAPAIFCMAYGGNNTNNKNSSLYIYNSEFYNNTAKMESGKQLGGAVVRSYTADNCKLQMMNCKLYNNKSGTIDEAGNTTQTEEKLGKSGGGAIYWKSAEGSARLINCEFTNNKSTVYGGAIYNTGTMSIESCTFKNNTAYGNGGAIAVEPPYAEADYSVNPTNGSLTLDAATTIDGNTAHKNGGGIYFNVVSSAIGDDPINIYEMQLHIEGATIKNNTAKGNGGAIGMQLAYENRNYTNGITIHPGSSITGNKATGETKVDEKATGNGGAIWMSSAANCDRKLTTGVQMLGGTLENNTATGNGGAIYIEALKESTAQNQLTPLNFTVSDGTVSKNTATGNGGASFIKGGNFIMNGGNLGEESKPNAAAKGGGVYVEGGSVTVTNGNVQYNTATNGDSAYITGGDIVLDGSEASLMHNAATNGAGIYLTGGKPLLLQGKLSENTATADGGGIYINQQNVTLDPTHDVEISANQANRGAGIFIGGTNGRDASFSVSTERAGNVRITDNTSTEAGGGVCIDKGYFSLSAANIDLLDNKAQNGGAVAVLNGNFTLSGVGAIGAEGHGNEADNGGAVYVENGNVTIEDASTGNETAIVQYNNAETGGGIYVNGGSVAIAQGLITHNTAENSGGAIAVQNGTITMSGGEVSHNTAATENGGAMYVSASDASPVFVNVYSGTLSDNIAAQNGGAVAVEGSADSTINVQIGVNKKHFEGETSQLPFNHTESGKVYTHASCPIIQNNTAANSGGAFFITGGSQTELEMYCLVEEGNKAVGDVDVNDQQLSDFMMVNGGEVLISTAESENSENQGYGNAQIGGSLHVSGGKLTLLGSMENPSINAAITVDLLNKEDYIDNRVDAGKIRFSYNENFTHPDGRYDSTQTAYDRHSGDIETISSSLYVHPGYEIVGWSTKENAKPNDSNLFRPNQKFMLLPFSKYDGESLPQGTTSHTVFPANDNETGTHYGDLTLYAVWQANFYYVDFEAGVEEVSGEDMPTQYYVFGAEHVLPANTFINPGYVFDGWKGSDGKEYTNGAKVSNLTTVSGGTVTLTAKWKKCEHDDAEKISCTVTKTSEYEVTAVRKCGACQYKATVKLTATDHTYNKSEHPAVLENSDPVWWPLSISYTAKTIKPLDAAESWDAEPIENANLCTYAGNYTATLMYDPDGTGENVATEVTDVEDTGLKASVSYTIKKAVQPAPEGELKYQKPTTGGSRTLIINTLPKEDRTATKYEGAKAEYVVRHYDTNGPVDEIFEVTNLELDAVSVELDATWTTYSVLVRYEETANYLPSEMLAADETFFFTNGLMLIIKSAPGITARTEGASDSTGESAENGTGNKTMTLYLELDTSYYLVDSKTDDNTLYDFTLRDIDSNDSEYDSNANYVSATNYIAGPTTIQGKPNQFSISGTLPQNYEETKKYVAVLEIGTTKKKPVITGQIAEREHFGDFTPNDNTSISNDSAYTMRYTVSNYDTAAYQEPELSFNETTLPEDTKIIMRDRNTGTYWSANAGNQSSISLDSFTQMGTSNTKYSVESGDLDLQFIVDFSDGNSLNDASLNSSLLIKKKEKVTIESDGAGSSKEIENKAPDLTALELNAQLTQTSFALTTDTQSSTALNLTVNGASAATKWEGRKLSLVLTPSHEVTLPDDAYIRATGITIATVHPNPEGNIIIPLGTYEDLVDNNSQQIKLELRSGMFPQGEKTYSMTAKLYVSDSATGKSPMSSSCYEAANDLSFSNSKSQIGVKISVTDDQRLFENGENSTIEVQVDTESASLAEGHTLTVSLYRRYQDGTYGNTGVRPTHESNTNSYTFSLAGTNGSYCIIATVSLTDGFVVAQDNYYFITQQPVE